MSATPAGEALEVTAWFERDRRHLGLSRSDGTSIFDLFDEAVDEAIEAGFLTTPRKPRPTAEDRRQHLMAYAHSSGLLT